MKTLTLLATLSLTFALSAVAAPKDDTAAEKPAAKAPGKGDAKAKKNTYPLYGLVVSCNTRTLTIKGGEGKENSKYTISSDTIVTKDDKPASTADVKEGQWVGGLLEKATDGNDKVLKLNLSVKQKQPKPAAGKEGDSKSKKKAE